MNDASLLVRALRDPSSVESLRDDEWTGLVSMARAESLLGSLAYRLERLPLPPAVARIMADARASAEQGRVQALWEAEMARRALSPLGVPVVQLKGSAYAAAGLEAAAGRSIGDLDILVPKESLDAVQAALLAAGWEWMKEDPYDDLYYRQWMHELPPLIHRERDRMIDVHHTILPPTARPTPDSEAMLKDSLAMPDGLRVLSPVDMVLHAVAHMLADGDLAGGLRNLWDLDRMLRGFGKAENVWEALGDGADRHQLRPHLALALRLAARLYGTPVEARIAGNPKPGDRLFEQRLLARDGWGREIRKGLRFGFYVRSHWMRMPPLMLARHLWTKARKQGLSAG